jgi:hypothetical protein
LKEALQDIQEEFVIKNEVRNTNYKNQSGIMIRIPDVNGLFSNE